GTTLLDILDSEQVKLVVMTTHGRTGLVRFALGSVADQLVRGSHVPVLLLRSASSPASAHAVDTALTKPLPVDWHLYRAIVPLDGSELAESALLLVRELAGEVFHHITLQRVLPLTAAPPRPDPKAGDDLPAITRLPIAGNHAVLDQIQHTIREHLGVDAQIF